MSTLCQKQYTISVIAPPSVTEYWKLDEPASPRVGSVQGVTMAPNGGPDSGSTAGIINNGVRLVGGNLYANSALLIYPASIGASWSFWIKFDSFGIGMLVNPYMSAGTLLIQLSPSFALNPSLRFEFIATGGGNPSLFLDYGTVPLHTWFFCVATFNQSTNQAKLYVNAGAPLSGNVVGVVTSLASSSVSLSAIGAGPDTVIDEMGVWMDHVLTAAEVTDLYNGGAGKTYPF